MIGDPQRLRFEPHADPAEVSSDPRQVPIGVAVAAILAAATSTPRGAAAGAVARRRRP